MDWLKLIRNFVTLALVGFAIEAVIASSIAQTRDCPNPTPFDRVDSAFWRLYYFIHRDSSSVLVYADNLGQHWTSYSTDRFISEAHISPDGSLIAIQSGESTDDLLEIVDLSGHVIFSDSMADAGTLSGWKDNETVLYQNLQDRLLTSINYKTDIATTVTFPSIDDDSVEDRYSLSFSSDFEYVIYPIVDGDGVENRLFVTRSVATSELIATVRARWTSWSSDSSTIYALDADGSASLFDLRGQQIRKQPPPAEMLPVIASFLPSGEILVLAGTPGKTRNQVLPQTMIAISDDEGEFRDLCIYATLFPLRLQMFDAQIGLWSPDSTMFAFFMNTALGPSIFALNIDNYSISRIGVEVRPVLLVGWSEVAN